MKTFPTLKEIITHLDLCMVGQDLAKRRLASAAYEHFYTVVRDGSTKPKTNILIVGPTGSGKTYLIEKLGEVLGVFIHIINAAALTPEGYEGQHFSDSMDEMLKECGPNRERAEKAIVCLDELDKQRISRSANENLGRLVQQQLLAPLVDSKVGDLSTKNILFIATGAFVGLTDIVRARVGKKELSENEALDLLTPSDFSAFGIIPELLGRFTIRIHVERLSKEDFFKLVKSSKDPMISRKQQLFEENGCELVITEDAMLSFAEKAYTENLGVRGLQSIVCEACDSVQPRFEELRKAGTTRIEITAAVINEKAAPRVVRSDKRLSAEKAEGIKKNLDAFHSRISKVEAEKKEEPKSKPAPGTSEFQSELPFPLFPGTATSALTDDERKALDRLMEPEPAPPTFWERVGTQFLPGQSILQALYRWIISRQISACIAAGVVVYLGVIALGYSEEELSLREFWEVALARSTETFWHLAALSAALCAVSLKRYSPANQICLGILLSHLGVCSYVALVAIGARNDVLEFRHSTLSWLRLLDHLLMRDGYVTVWNAVGAGIAIYLTFFAIPPNAGEDGESPFIVRSVMRRWGRGPREEEEPRS